MIGVTVTAVATAWLVLATRAGHRSRFVAKPLASLGFLLVVASQPLEPGTRADLVVVGLVLGAIGDVVLMGRSDKSFLVGLAAFLLGHAAYLIAFILDIGSAGWIASGVVVAFTVGVVVVRWLRPHLDAPFALAVPGYVVVICLMVGAAMASGRAHPSAAIGAVLFAASDVFVARDRFVTPSAVNATVGLPLYYLGQLAIAWSTLA